MLNNFWYYGLYPFLVGVGALVVAFIFAVLLTTVVVWATNAMPVSLKGRRLPPPPQWLSIVFKVVGAVLIAWVVGVLFVGSM